MQILIMEQNYYKSLGVSTKATHDEIKQAAQEQLNNIKRAFQEGDCRMLGVVLDADKITIKKAAEDRINKIKKAYSILGNVENKKNYDEKMGRNLDRTANIVTNIIKHTVTFIDFLGKISTAIISVGAIIVTASTIIQQGSKGHSMIKDFFSEKTTYISKAEQEIANEWVIRIDYADSREDAREKVSEFKRELEYSGYEDENCRKTEHGCWKDNIHAVRDIFKNGLWLVVVDRLNGVADEKSTAAEINHVLTFLKQSDISRQDRLGMWIKGSKPYYYQIDLLSSTYGRILNPPEELKLK